MIGQRRSGGFWLAVVALVATFVAEPGASLEVTRDALIAIGEFGGSLMSELASGESGA